MGQRRRLKDHVIKQATVRIDSGIIYEIGSPRIYASTAGRTREPSQRGQSHACVPARAVLDGASAGSASEMKGDDVELIEVFAEEISHGSRNESVADAMEAVFAQLVLLRYRLINRVCRNVRRNCRMEL
jgi:hypothetical protein